MKSLTARQQEVLDFIRASVRENGYAPTIREIGRHINVHSTNGVVDHLKALERKRFLIRTVGTGAKGGCLSRAIRLLNEPLSLPPPGVAPPTFDEVLSDARKLDRGDRVRLVAELFPSLVESSHG